MTICSGREDRNVSAGERWEKITVSPARNIQRLKRR
jgi:hypothetical protein